MCSGAPTGAATEDATPEAEETVLSIDADASIETGADLTRAAAAGIGRLEALAFRRFDAHPGLGAVARLTRAAFFDAPVAWWLGVVEHEVFGHGGRAREVGSSAGFHLGSPWGGRDSYATFSTTGLSFEDLLRVYAGGTEANSRTAESIERSLVSGRAPEIFELLFLASNRFVAADYVLRTTPDPVSDPAGFTREWRGGGDVARYLGYLHTRLDGTEGIGPAGISPAIVSQYRRMRRQAAWSALDPGAWLALWTAGADIFRGGGARPLPIPRWRGRPVLPVLSTDWLPEGSTAALQILIGDRPKPNERGRWRSLTMRRGRGPDGAIAAVGAAAEQFWQGQSWSLGGEAEIWSRPHRAPGGGIGIVARLERGRLAGLFVESVVKSAGAWPGRPARAGLTIRAGVVLRGNR